MEYSLATTDAVRTGLGGTPPRTEGDHGHMTKEVRRIAPAAIAELSEAQMAAELLRQAHGHQRNAEALAWEQADAYRTNDDVRGYFAAVARHIVEGTERPSQLRTPHGGRSWRDADDAAERRRAELRSRVGGREVTLTLGE